MVARKTNKARSRAFSTRKPEEVEPLFFEIDEERFDAHPVVPGAVILEFASGADGDGTGAAQILTFFERVLVPESKERFFELIHDTNRVVELELLSDIVGFLVEEYTDRPSEAS